MHSSSPISIGLSDSGLSGQNRRTIHQTLPDGALSRAKNASRNDGAEKFRPTDTP